MMSTNQKIGLMWEKWTLERLHEQGYGQARLVSNFFANVDIMLGNLPIEVKAAYGRRHWAGGVNRTRWQFDVSRRPKGVDSIIVLVAIAERPYAFIIPSWDMTPRYNVHITSHPAAYKGLYSKYLEAWNVIEAGLAIRAVYAGQLFLPVLVGVGSA